MTNLVHRLKTVGRKQVPATGGMLLVRNHLSQVDAMLFATGRRPVRFLM